jgi:hypothetical protein
MGVIDGLVADDDAVEGPDPHIDCLRAKAGSTLHGDDSRGLGRDPGPGRIGLGQYRPSGA